MDSIQKVNHRHGAIIDWLLCNPDKTLLECAAEFGYTKEWIYRLVNTDLFQAAYHRRAEELRSPVVHSIQAKIMRLANSGLDRAIEKIESGASSEGFHTSAMKMALEGLGYLGASGPTTHEHRHIHIDAQALVAARQRAMVSGVAEAKNDGDRV